jgi:hypothetical protein
MASRPSHKWRAETEQEAAELAAGTGSPDQAYAGVLWPESLIASTDAALAGFEAELAALLSASEITVDDKDILAVVRRAVLALNAINDQHVRTCRTGYETGEREDLCGYIDATLTESGIDLATLATRNGKQPGELIGAWRTW